MFKFYPRYIAVKILKIYQKTLSFDHGILKFLYPNGFCRFHPTCSSYAIQAVEKYGFIRGGLKAVWRVLRCNPFNSGGFDPLK
ncbi:MAG: membrane protein insertion efficiency factor YidD [Patescibacteria group bacterium]|nr:membrane protein insertion efficiency factor YidD [Patescibacteria group bacterium]